ncbi:hypothetical protein Tco_0510995 [Tanacetum coccineum]
MIKSQIRTMMDAQLSTRLEDSIKKSFRSYNVEFEKKAKDERKRYIDLVEKSVKDIIKDKSSSQPKLTYTAAASLTEFELKKILLDKIKKSKSYRGAQEYKDLYDALVKSYKLDKDLFKSYGKVYSLKRDLEDKDKDEDPPAGSNQGLKKQKTSKDSAQVEEPMFETADTEMPLNQGEDLGNTEDQPNIEATSRNDWFKKPKRPLTPDSDWNTTKLIDFRPPQTWINKIAKAGKPPTTFDELMSTPIDFSTYVLNNLKIENLTQEYLVAYDKYAMWGITHWGAKRQSFYGYASNRKSKHDVFSTKRIITVTHVKVVKKYDYGYLDEIIVRRENQQLYKFIEGDFPRLNLHDIKDMLLLLMFTRRVVILKQVEDLQLGVESYQKKLNITRPETFRLMRSDELYKFYDGTLSSIRRVLHDIASSLEMDYLPKRR